MAFKSLGKEIPTGPLGIPEGNTTRIEYPQISLSTKDFPQFNGLPVDHECECKVKLRILGRPEYGSDAKDGLRLSVVALEPPAKEKSPAKQMGY